MKFRILVGFSLPTLTAPNLPTLALFCTPPASPVATYASRCGGVWCSFSGSVTLKWQLTENGCQHHTPFCCHKWLNVPAWSGPKRPGSCVLKWSIGCSKGWQAGHASKTTPQSFLPSNWGLEA